MWFDAVKRFLRRRFIIIFIFALCFIYILMHLLRNGGPLSMEDDELVVHRERPLIWRTLQEHIQSDSGNKTNDQLLRCRNTVQGKTYMVDELGYLCHRGNLLSNGCCNVEENTTKHYTCDTCNEAHCCEIYEYCVSCCLHPSKRPMLELVLEKATGRQAMVYAIVEDNFELCLVKCRTNSHSVQHENRYRDPNAKYCYGHTEAHESQREVSGSAGH